VESGLPSRERVTCPKLKEAELGVGTWKTGIGKAHSRAAHIPVPICFCFLHPTPLVLFPAYAVTETLDFSP
jgi:hypothetical protein